MHRALPGGALLLIFLVAIALSGGCVALYTVSEVADPPPNAPGGDARAGLPLFPPGLPDSMPVPTPSATTGPAAAGGDGEPFVPAPSNLPPDVEEMGPTTGAPTTPLTVYPSEPPAAPITWVPTASVTVYPSEPLAAPITWVPTASVTVYPSEPPAAPITRVPTAPVTLSPSTPGQTLAIDDGLPGRDEAYHPIVTPLSPV